MNMIYEVLIEVFYKGNWKIGVKLRGKYPDLDRFLSRVREITEEVSKTHPGCAIRTQMWEIREELRETRIPISSPPPYSYL